MNNAKLWLVVKPTVGVPLFLSAVAIGSFAVHLAVLSKTNWYEDYLLGKPLGSSAATTAMILDKGEAPTAHASYTQRVSEGAKEVLITMPDGTVARAILETPTTVASIDGLPAGKLSR